LEYDFRVAPGADPQAIALKPDGSAASSLDAEGNLVLASAAGDVSLKHPEAYQEVDGVRRAISSKFRIGPANTITFELGAYDHTQPLIIDPVLTYGAAFGGSDGSWGVGMDVDAAGNVYVTGNSCSTDFPTTSGNFQKYQPNPALYAHCLEAFVLKLDPTLSTLIYSDYIGGSDNTTGGHIAVDTSGNAYVTGGTVSSDFPLVSNIGPASPQPCKIVSAGHNCPDGFVFKLSPDGSTLLFSSLLGGSQATGGFNLKLNPITGDLVIWGDTDSADLLPAPNTLQTTFAGESCTNSIPCFNAFLMALDPSTGAYRYGTFFGSVWYTFASGLAFDASGDIYLTGSADPPLSPSLGNVTQTYAGQGATGSNSHAFVARLHPNKNTLTPVYLTLIEGSQDDAGTGIALDAAGNAYIVGSTSSPDLPTTTGVFQPTTASTPQYCSWPAEISSFVPEPCGTAFVAKLNPAGALGFLTYLGGSGQSTGQAIGVDSAGNLWLTGLTSATDFPFTKDAYQPNGNTSGFFDFNPFLAEMSGDGSTLTFASPIASYFGESTDLKIDSANNVYVTGYAQAAPSTPGTYPGNEFTSSQIYNPMFVQKWSAGLEPVATISAKSLDFGPVSIGSNSTPQTVTLSNTGAGVMQVAIQNITTLANGNPFVESDNCGATLAPSASCTLTVSLEPLPLPAGCTVASGCDPEMQSATIFIQTNAPTGTQKITLSGTAGMGPIVSVMPNPIAFLPQIGGTSSTAQNVTISDFGDLPLVPASISITGPDAADFQLTEDASYPCTAPTTTQCFLTIVFSPAASATGTRTAALNIVDNAADSPQSIPITGSIATAPAALELSSTTISYLPAAIGALSPEFPPYSFSVTNTSSTTSVQVTGVTVTGPNAADFTLSPNQYPRLPYTLAPGVQLALDITFQPTGGLHGPRTATATITTDPAIAGLPVVQLQGVAVTNSDPTLSFFSNPSPLDFGSVVVGQSTAGTNEFLQIDNAGPYPCGGGASTCGGPLVISSIVSGLSDFTIVPNDDTAGTAYCTTPPLTIPAQGGCDFTILFAPTQAGVRSTTFTINSNDVGGPQSFPVTGAGLALAIGNLSATGLNFGYAAIGVASPPLTVNLQNTGTTTLMLSSVAPSANYEVASNTCSPSIAPGATCTIGVTLTPPTAGAFSGTLTITDNDGLGSQQLVSLRGIGATGPSLMILPSAVNFGNQALSAASTPQPVTLTNFGDAPVTFPANAFVASNQLSVASAPVASAQFSVASTTCGSTLAPQASCTVNLQFEPTVAQSESGTLVVTDNARANPQTIYLTGVGVQSGSFATATTLSSSLNPANTGQSITFTATVAGTTSNTPLPTGGVNFLDGSTIIGSGTLNGGAQATFTTSSLIAGTHSITAVYTSDSNYATSTSPVLSQVVNGPVQASSTTSLGSSVNPATTGQSVTFTATVAGTTSNTPEPTGSVTFLDGTTTLGSGTLNASGQATYTTSSLSEGSHSITAVYSSDSNYAASKSAVLSEVVNAPPLVVTATTLSSSANPATTGQSITFSATVAGTTTNTPLPTGSVTFFDGTVSLGSPMLNSSATATFSTGTLAQGTHQITAQYSGDGDYLASTSTVLNQVVNVPASFTIAISPTTLTITRGQRGSVTLTATSAGGFSQPISLACSGLAQYASCTFSPATITPAANASATSSLTIATDVKSASRGEGPASSTRTREMVSYALMLGVGLSIFRKRRDAKRKRVFLPSVFFFALLAGLAAVNLVGCGGGHAADQTPIGTSSVSVTATSGTDVQTVLLTVNVQ
jgi:hypothetical protein